MLDALHAFGAQTLGAAWPTIWLLARILALSVALLLWTKEVLTPARAARGLYIVAPVMAVAPALAAWAVIPFQANAVLGDINAGLLYVAAISSIGVYGVILAGWASNSKYAFLGAMRA